MSKDRQILFEVLVKAFAIVTALTVYGDIVRFIHTKNLAAAGWQPPTHSSYTLTTDPKSSQAVWLSGDVTGQVPLYTGPSSTTFSSGYYNNLTLSASPKAGSEGYLNVARTEPYPTIQAQADKNENFPGGDVMFQSSGTTILRFNTRRIVFSNTKGADVLELDDDGTALVNGHKVANDKAAFTQFKNWLVTTTRL